ncbi:MAG: hydroxymethylbilane synthase [Chloroflexi bacterium]|nr:hydroxymethylbilane synthase [Chloroflexota bacterium]
MRTKIVVGSRGSRLALIQAESVVNRLKFIHPDLEISIKKIVTAGDRDHHTQLDRIGVDVFVKELEEALLDGRIDLAVHSLKDVPTDIPQGLGLIAVTERDDPRDVLVAKAPLYDLIPGSLRRTLQVAQIRPDLETCSIRGNVDTRLRKVSSGEVDGVILAGAALSRLGWQDKITQYLPLKNFLPAAGQGALVVEARSDDKEIVDRILPINHLPTWQCISAERMFLRELGGGCRAPIAALGTLDGIKLRLEGMVASPAGKKVLRDSIEGDVTSSRELGVKLAGKMLEMGASEFIAEARRNEIR